MAVAPERNSDVRLLFKDAILDHLAETANVAQFVSFDADGDLQQRFSRVLGFRPNHPFVSPGEAVETLLSRCREGSVNVRSFDPEFPKSREFLYGLKQVDEVLAHVKRLSGQGLYTIVNETIDVEDGGVSGVAFGGIVEFAPEDTPRCVEKPDAARLPYNVAMDLVEKVYGFRPELDYDARVRVEFSLHPQRRGWHNGHTIVWEAEKQENQRLETDISWPNRFSRFIGDKAYGLLVADCLGLPVPRTVVFTRRLMPFLLGQPTGGEEVWIRTCPMEPVPGRYATYRGWRDPYAVMAEEDPDGAMLASVLCQQEIPQVFSGALVTRADGSPVIEGVAGRGDAFMKGRARPAELPVQALKDVRETYDRACKALGPVRMEWVYDGSLVWVVQIHTGRAQTRGLTIYSGEAKKFHKFDISRNDLDALRKFIAELEGSEDGVIVVGNIGLTSHVADLLRRAQIPSRLERV